MVAKTVAEVRNFLGWIPRRKKITITAMSQAAFLHLYSDNDSRKHFMCFIGLLFITFLHALCHYKCCGYKLIKSIG